MDEKVDLAAESSDGSTKCGNCCKPACRFYILLVVVTVICVLAMFGVNGYYSVNMGRVVENETESSFEISPSPWAFSVWGLIYFWQLMMIIYVIVSCVSRFGLHRVPALCFPFYWVNIGCNVGWLFVSDRLWYWPGVGTIFGLPVTLYFAIGISLVGVVKHKSCGYYLYTFVVHNAWAVYAGWTTVASLLYLGISLIHSPDGPHMSQQMTGTIMLAILMGELVLFCTLELTVLDKYLRHVFAHYIPLVIAVVGSLDNNWDPDNRNSIMTVAIAGFVACAACVKVGRMFLDFCKRPDLVRIERM